MHDNNYFQGRSNQDCLLSNDKNQQEKQQNYKFQIPEANPIQKRQILSPKSIFPLLPLPTFQYTKESPQATLPSSTQSEVFEFSETNFCQIFSHPIYTYSPRTQTSNNLQFGCLRVNYGESATHSDLKVSTNKKTNELIFESRFESGNLSLAAKASEKQYNLLLSRDMNTTKCTQWFFFRTLNSEKGKYTFHILNFVKNYSVFQNGMKICICCRSDGYQWFRGGTNIKYRKSNIPVSAKKHKFYYVLSFSYDFQKSDDQVYFAYCYPYTYSMLEHFLHKTIEDSPCAKRRNIAVSPGGNYVDMVTITNPKNRQKKRMVLITARVHPGETPSSFVCEGMIRFLMSEHSEAQALRNHFVFKFVPMLNPDGVINGSYRCSLSGNDLNRVWHRAEKYNHPQIYGVKRSIEEMDESNLFLFVDLHAHSKKKGVFMYGCQNRLNPYLCRQVPFLLWKNVPEFNYYQCNFGMKMGREGTSRLFMYNSLELSYSYTMEHSFCGSSKQKVHFKALDYYIIGNNFLSTLHKFFCKLKKDNQTQTQTLKELYMSKQFLKIGENEDADSSSDEELEKEKQISRVVYSSLEKPEPKKVIVLRKQRETSVLVQPSIRRSKTNFHPKKISPQKQIETKNQIGNKFLGKINPLSKQLPIVGPQFRNSLKDEINPSPVFNRSRACFSSLTTNKHEDQLKEKKQTWRYSDEEDVNSLTSLFLPSLKSASYKKYGRKIPNSKNIVHIGKNLIENAKILKDEIKAVEKKKMNWKEHARSFF